MLIRSSSPFPAPARDFLLDLGCPALPAFCGYGAALATAVLAFLIVTAPTPLRTRCRDTPDRTRTREKNEEGAVGRAAPKDFRLGSSTGLGSHRVQDGPSLPYRRVSMYGPSHVRLLSEVRAKCLSIDFFLSTSPTWFCYLELSTPCSNT
jgi:hypothetical protein